MQKAGMVSSVPDEQVQKTGRVHILNNFLFTGTITVDDATRSMSDKVMDRANTLEFVRVDLDNIPRPGGPVPFLLSASTWYSYQVTDVDARFRSQMIAMNQILQKADPGPGYQVLHEIERYLANSVGLLDPLVAFNLQVKQRTLRRVRSSAFISEMLAELQKFLADQHLERSAQRLSKMQKRLEHNGYTNFWR